jgi:DNA-binding CsgD family transcriptional regulator
MAHPIESAAWHRLFGGLVEALDKPNFWNILLRYLSDAVPYDNWVVLLFSREHKPLVLAESPSPDGGDDELFQDYLNGFYLLDPFYIACMDDPRAGLLRLDDVAPDRFEAEDYYQRYFKLNIVMDEVQFNLPLGEGGVLILSLGSRRRFGIEDMSLLSAITPWILALMRQRASAYELNDTAPSAEPVAEGIDSSATLTRGSSNLTNRELEIVHLLLSGFSSKGIAQKLKISPETVKGHRKHIYTKLGVKSHAELFAIYLQAKNEAR